jgi:7-keto-8-aminopelargonate synthetase-like enzyme
LQRLLDDKVGGTVFLDERHCAGVFGADGFHGGGIEGDGIYTRAIQSSTF